MIVVLVSLQGLLLGVMKDTMQPFDRHKLRPISRLSVHNNTPSFTPPKHKPKLYTKMQHPAKQREAVQCELANKSILVHTSTTVLKNSSPQLPVNTISHRCERLWRPPIYYSLWHGLHGNENLYDTISREKLCSTSTT